MYRNIFKIKDPKKLIEEKNEKEKQFFEKINDGHLT
jgi:hypothetical protein